MRVQQGRWEFGRNKADLKLRKKVITVQSSGVRFIEGTNVGKAFIRPLWDKMKFLAVFKIGIYRMLVKPETCMRSCVQWRR